MSSLSSATPPTTPTFVIVDLTTTYGALFLGLILSNIFWGLTFLQTIYYFHAYPSDKRHSKVGVLLLFMMNTAHEIVGIVPLWESLITNYGNTPGLALISKIQLYPVLTNSFVAFAVQSFFCYRIFIFFNQKILKFAIPLLIFPFIVSKLAASMVYFQKATHIVLESELASLQTLGIGGSALAAAADVCIAVTMCSLLATRRTGMTNTNRILTLLIITTINTGAWTACFSVVSIALLAQSPTHLLYCITYTPLCSLYTNTLLANLNIRNILRQSQSLSTPRSHGFTSQNSRTDRYFGNPPAHYGKDLTSSSGMHTYSGNTLALNSNDLTSSYHEHPFGNYAVNDPTKVLITTTRTQFESRDVV